MRVVILHESPGADSLAREFVEAAQAFNRGLDFRLRFLDVGFTLRTVSVADTGDVPALLLEGTLQRFTPGVVLVLGGGLALVECAALVSKYGVPIAYYTDGEPDRSTHAIARLSHWVLATDAARRLPVGPDALAPSLAPGEAPGPALVALLARSVRRSP